MFFNIRPRLGIGFDIEHSNDIWYHAGFVNEENVMCEGVFPYTGLVIKIPFFTINIGELLETDDD